jgi:Arc/MetJ-type ribon-helix-helix transcriptional regulator
MIECPFCGAASETRTEHWPCPALPAPRPTPIDGIVADPDAGRYTERVTLRIPRSLETAIEELVDEGAYASRSQAIRAVAFEAFVARQHTDQRCAIADGGAETNGEFDTDADTDALDEGLRAALIESDCHPDFRHYCGRAADQGGTPILESVRHLHDASDVARVPVLGTAIETTLWREGAERTLTKHGHVDETNATILEAIVEADDAASDLVTDGGVLPADDPRSIEHRLENADAQLECALERLDDTQEPWVANTLAAMLEDLRDLRTLLDGSTDRPEGRR